MSLRTCDIRNVANELMRDKSKGYMLGRKVRRFTKLQSDENSNVVKVLLFYYIYLFMRRIKWSEGEEHILVFIYSSNVNLGKSKQ